MKNKKMSRAVIALTLVAAVAFSAALAGCSDSEGERTPASVIQDEYGNEQYTISFSTDTLDTPINDIYYTASSMPTLPTPERVGYIFEGWYLDSDYTTPYVDGILLLYMTDVTLYAKWTEETFATNGTYDIEFATEIVEGSVTEGEWTAALGGYDDFGDDIIEDETYIEKTDDGLRLRIQYDCGVTVPYGYDDVYEVGISSLMRNSVSIVETIAADSESVKTIYIDIDDFDIADTLYLSVEWTNWKEEGIENAYRAYTTTTYTIAFDITRLIGFSRPFADTSVPLEDGYYLVQTHYVHSSGGTDSMAESYNAVFSYLIAEDGNYTLVKPFNPYAGFLGTTGGSTQPEDYFERAMTYIPLEIYYTLGQTDFSGGSSADYLPEAYDAGYYGEYSVEFHADTGRFYSIYDLGDSLDKSLMVVGSVTGAMEAVGAAGTLNMILTIDTEHIVRLTSIDYEPLEGDSYGVGDSLQYYAGDLDDLNERNLSQSAVEDYGIATTLYNFFYSSAGTMYSSRITVTPTASTNAMTVADSRYYIGEFTLNAQVYGYDPTTDGDLYADCYTVDTFGGLGIRQWNKVVQGISCSSGETLSLQDIYDRFTRSGYSLSSSNVTYVAYSLTAGGDVNYSSPVTIGATVTYSGDMAIVFTTRYDSGTSTTIVKLTAAQSPDIEVENIAADAEAGTPAITFTTEDGIIYTASGTYTIGDSLQMPQVTYVWGDTEYSFIGDWYDNDADGIDPTRVALFTVDGGAWSLTYLSRDSVYFTASADEMYLVYEITNAYGERTYIYIYYIAGQTAQYEISSSIEDELLLTGQPSYSDGIRNDVSAERSYMLSSVNADDLTDELEYYLDAQYTIIYADGTEGVFGLYSVYIYGSSSTYGVASGNQNAGHIANYITGNISGYAYVLLTYRYTYGGVTDNVYIRLIYGTTMNGRHTSDLMTHTDYFTGYTYQFYVPAMYSDSGVLLGNGTVSVRAYSGDELLSVSQSTSRYTLTNSGLQYSLTFNSTGRYRISYSIALSRDENGDRIFNSINSVSMTFYQYITVLDGTGEVTVTFVTDSDHPFGDDIPAVEYSDGQMTGWAYKVTYSLAESIYVLGQSSNFASTKDSLFGWVTDAEKFDETTTAYVYNGGSLVTDFIGEFNAQEVTLYAVWVAGVQVVLDYGDVLPSSQYITRNYYLGDNGYYSIDVSAWATPSVTQIPSGYSFVGWTGGFIGDSIVTSGTYRIYPTTAASNDYVYSIKAVYKANISVSYVISSTYSSLPILPGITVVDGNTLTSSQYESAMGVRARSGYTFYGWAYKNADGEYVEIDLAEDAIELSLIYDGSATLVLYAGFTDEDGTLYWSE